MDIATLLDRPIAFHRALVTVTGSVQAALMLSQALYWTRRTPDSQGWFYKNQEIWEEETGLTRREQECARRHLRGLLIEKRQGTPARLYYRVDTDALMDRLLPIKNGAFRQSSLALSSHQEWRFPPISTNTKETNTETKEETIKPSCPNPGLDDKLEKPVSETVQRVREIIKASLFPYYIENIRPGSERIYTLTPKRMSQGVLRFQECLRKTAGNWQRAEALMKIAIDTMAGSDWHMGRDEKSNGRRYNDWELLFRSTEKLEWWFQRSLEEDAHAKS